MATLLLRDLTPATRYKVQIRAVEGDSVSEWSRLFDLETIMDDVSPDVPDWDGIGWVSSGDTFVATWIPIDPAQDQNLDFAFYEVELSDGTNTTIINTQNNSYTLTFSDNRTMFGTPKPTVLARVRAVDAVGNKSAWNTQKSASNPRPTAPASITPTAVSDGIGLKWDASPDNDVIGYQVHTGSAAGFTPTAGNRIFSGNALEFNYATLTYGTDHWFKVYAVDVFGQTSLTPTATTQAVRPVSPFIVDTVPPNIPTGLSVTITNNTSGIGSSAIVSWTMASVPSDLAGFYVRYRKVGDTNWSTVPFQKDDRAGIIELVSAFQNYQFQIKAVDSYANESAWSATVTATAPANTPPPSVTGLTGTPTRDAITYQWTPVADNDIRNYEVTFSTSSTFASGNITFLTGEAAFVNVGGLMPGTPYYARVRAVDTGGLASDSWSPTNTTSTLAQLTPGDIGAPTDVEFIDLSTKVDGSIQSYSSEYAVNSSETTAPTTGWSTTTPTRAPGQFVWIRTVVTYHDDTTSTTNPALLTGNTGASGSDGDDGAPGRGISSTAVSYAVSSSGTVAPSTGWQSTVPATSTGQFLWTRTVTTFTDATTTTAYSVAAHGATGQQGATGVGISSSAVTYQASASGTTAPTGTWTTTVPTVTAGQFLWTRTILTYTDNSTSSPVYAVARSGTNGTNGVSVTAITRYWLRQTAGAGTPATPGNVASPGGSWTTIEPDYLDGTELWMMDRISYSNSTYSYTTAAKSSSYAAAVAAMNSANGVNRVFWSTTAATGTSLAGRNFVAGDTWFQRDGAGKVIGQWEYLSNNTWASRQINHQMIASIDVGNMTVIGQLSAANIDATSLTIGQSQVTGLSDELAARQSSIIRGNGNLKIFNNVLAWEQSGNAIPGSIVITTPLTLANHMTKIDITGYNYRSAEGTSIDAAIEFYTNTTGTFANRGLSTYGSRSISATLGINANGNVVIVLDNPNGTWYYPKIFIPRATIGHSAVPDSYLTGWSAQISTDPLAGLTNVYAVAGRDIDENFDVTNAWRFTGTTEINGGKIRTDTIDVIKLKAGSTFTQTLNVASTFTVGTASTNGIIQSYGYVANSTGWRLDKTTGLEINNGKVKASTLIGDTIGSSTGVINVAAGASLVFNGGYLKSNTYTVGGSPGTAYSAAATAGWYLGNDGLRIAQGSVSANAFATGVLSSATITMGTSGIIQTSGYNGTSGFRLSSSGLEIPDGSLQAAKLIITSAFSNSVGASMTTIDGGIIKTGSIQSQTNITVNGVSVPAWSINTQGYASFAGAQILGNTVLGNAGTDTNSRIQSFNYVAGSTGWMIRADGSAEFSTASLRGSLTIGQITNLQTELNAKATTTYVDTTAQTKADEAEMAALDALATNTNSAFGNWTSTYPVGYTLWGGTVGTVVKETALAKTINAVRFNLALNVDGGLNAASSFGAATHAEYVAVEIDVMLVSNGGTASFNGAGIILDWNTGTHRTTVSLGAAVPAPVFGKWYKVVQIIRKPENSADVFAGFIMANWSGFGAPRDAKNIVFDRVAVRPATDAEIQGTTAVAQIQGMWGSQQDKTFIDGGNIYTDTITLDKLRGGSLNKVITLDTGSSLLANGVMGEQVAMGDFGFFVKGPQENNVTNKASSGTTRTITTAVAHNFKVGQKIVVKISDTVYDNNQTNKFWTVATVPTATTFTYAGTTSLTQASTAVAAGIVQGSNSALPAGQDYIVFPTDGTEPNIISGQLTASDVVITEGMSIRKGSDIEQGATLTINHVVEAPKIIATLSQNYSEIQLKGYSGGLIGFARGHNGNYFVLAGTTNDYRISEHDQSGNFIANRVTYEVNVTSYRTPRGFTFGNGRYYLHYQNSSRLLITDVVETFNTSWTSQGTYNIGQNSDGTDPFPKGRIGWDFTNNRPMIGFRAAGGSSNVTARYYTIHATTGVITGAVAGDVNVTYASGKQIGFISRGSFDYGADRIVVKDSEYSDTYLAGMQYCVALNTGAVDGTRNWPVAGNSTIVDAIWDTTLNKFVDLSSGGVKRTYEGGDSFWLSTNMQDGRWVRYAWYNAANDAETNLSGPAAFALSKRARLSVTISPVPFTGGSTPDRARVYVLDNPTDTFPTVTNYRLRATIPHTSQYASIDPGNLGTVGTAQATVNDFMAYGNSPGMIVSSTGNSFWKGDDTAQFFQLVVTSSTEATTASGNKPALRIGNIAGAHLRIDSNEIIAMANDSSRNGATLELSADNINFNVVNGGIQVIGHANHRGKLRSMNDAGASIVFLGSSVGISGATQNPSSFGSSNTGPFHAAGIHSWAGGIYMEDLSGGGNTGASIGNGGRIVRTSSSKRFKKAIKPLPLSEAKKSLLLEPVSFQWKKEVDMGDARQAGFIAEQADDVGMGLWVTREKNGRPQGFRYPELTAAHNLLIKDLYAERDAFKAKAEDLEKRMERLEALVEALSG